jgi:hypothetical protein
MIDGIEQYYREIAESMSSAIPEEFSTAKFEAIFYEGSSHYEAEYRRKSDGVARAFQPADGGDRAFRQLRKKFKEAGKPVWGQATFELQSDGRFNMKWGYENCDENGNTRFDEEKELRRSQENFQRLTASVGQQSLIIDDAALRRDVLAFLRSPASAAVFEAIDVPWWLSATGAVLLACAGLCMLPTIIWTLAGLRALWSVLRLEQFRVANPRQHPEKLVPLIGYSVIFGPDKRHGLVLATFASQSNFVPGWMADRASHLASLYTQCKAGTNQSQDDAICSLLCDDTFHPSRRRKLPLRDAKNADLWLLDVEVNPRDVFVWPNKAALFAFVAEPGERGDVVQIPWSIVANAVSIASWNESSQQQTEL